MSGQFSGFIGVVFFLFNTQLFQLQRCKYFLVTYSDVLFFKVSTICRHFTNQFILLIVKTNAPECEQT